MGYPETAEGYLIHDHKEWSTFKRGEFKLKPFGEYDVDVAIDACGVCASDLHTITGGWGDAPLPLCVGHEVIGRAIKVGDKVTKVKLGDRVGVGAQVGADLTCDNCKQSQENYCPNMIDTYGAPYPDGTLSQGGFSSHIRAHEYFTFTIPDNIETSLAAPMLCAGITTYSPLVRLGAGPGKKVGIVGLGGLGHFGVLWAKALGAEVYVLSHSPSKEQDAFKMGATKFICTKDKDWHKPLAFSLDFIINTADKTDQFNLPDYLSTLKVQGTLHHVGLPDAALPQLKAQDYTGGFWSMSASHLGNRQEMEAMLELASKQNIKSWVETIDVSEEGCKQAVERVHKVDVRYRFTLVNFDKQFGKRS